MKNVIIALTGLLFSLPAMAVGPAPSYLQGATITVTLKNGKTYTFSADEYAVVKRGEETPLQVTKLEDETEEKLVLPPEEVVGHKNIVSVGAVYGKNKLKTSQTGNKFEVESDRTLGLQLQYQRRMDDKVYLGGQADTNGSVGVNVGVGF